MSDPNRFGVTSSRRSLEEILNTPPSYEDGHATRLVLYVTIFGFGVLALIIGVAWLLANTVQWLGLR